jgi:hypothetical protein
MDWLALESLSNFKNILRQLIELEMELATDPLYLKTNLKRIKLGMVFLKIYLLHFKI